MVYIIGHRGGRDLWPENSLTGFRNLAAMPVDGVEFDVHLTRAGELLVIHDAMLERTTSAIGPVAALPAGARHEAVLKGSDGEGIPTLDEVLAIFAPTGMQLHVELKADAEGRPYPGLERRVADRIGAFGLMPRSIMTSFLPEVLAAIRAECPSARRLSSFDRKSADRLGLAAGLATMLELSDIIAVEKSLLREHWREILAMVPADRLGAWVTNSQEDLEYWMSKPIRQVTTDRPDRAIEARRS